MKKVYEFTINQEIEVEKTEISKDETGAEITKKTKVKELVPRKFLIKRPSRAEQDDTELFRAASESDYIKKGVLPVNLLQKRLLNDGGILTDQQQKQYDDLKESFVTKQSEYVELSNIIENDRTEEQKQKIDVLLKELAEIINKINKLDNISSNLYNRTAEALARNKTILYLVLTLSFEEKDGKNIPIFGEGNYESKLKKYDEIEEREDDFEYKLVQKLQLISGAWYLGRCSTKEDFDTLIKLEENSNLLNLV